jgi:chondroitin 4-sulfotransferase 11
MRRRAISFLMKLMPFSLKNEIWIRTKYKRLRKGSEFGYSLQPFDELKCLFVHIPKTAGVSVCRSLFGNNGSGHIPLSAYRRVFGQEAFDSYFKFCFVRNPWDRLVSAYSFLSSGGMDKEDAAFARKNLREGEDFGAFVRRWVNRKNVSKALHFIPQTEWVRIGDDPVGVDFVGKFEQIGVDFDEICRRLGLERGLGHHNRSKRRDYRELYDAETISIVADVYRDDVAHFSYQFEE